MIKDIQELNFPKKDGLQYATLSQATVSLEDMGEKTISAQVKLDGDIVPDFSYDWAVVFQGEKYIMPLRQPAGEKGNESLKSTVDLTFQHWAMYQLKRWPFVTIQQIAAGTYLPDEEEASVQLNLKDFCTLFGQVLQYYYGETIAIDLNPDWQYATEATQITISHTTIWNVLIDAFYNQYGVRWEIKAASDNSNTTDGGERYVIRVGYPTSEVDHIFEYGFEGGLLKLERQVQSEDIRNVLKGRGGDTNIPFRYFKDVDTNNPSFAADPDWVKELENISFGNLMGATFRSYVQGWKHAHLNDKDAEGNLLYPDYDPVGESNAYAPWAYEKGYTDTSFQPVEFVADEITINPSEEDKQVSILPGYSPYVTKGSSLDKYGPLVGTLDNNDDIYPTIQGTGMDVAVDVEQIKSDDVAESAEKEATVSNIKGAIKSEEAESTEMEITVDFPSFSVAAGQTANLSTGELTKKAFMYTAGASPTGVSSYLTLTESPSITVTNTVTGETHSASGIPSGTWKWSAKIKVKLAEGALSPLFLTMVTVGYEAPYITSSDLADEWTNTFDIWVKNIWSTSKQTGETDAQYAERVWTPILGDSVGDTAKVVFTSGALVHEDYEFVIAKVPVYDTSKTYGEDTSHWRITLAKSDAELESTGLYVPSTKKQGKAGDTFAFTGTEMTHSPYVTEAEKRLDDWKKDELADKKEVKPTIVVTTDRVRINGSDDSDALIGQLRVGNSIRVADARFITPSDGKAYETLYLQSMTYTFREPGDDDTALNPDVEITLGEEYATSANPVSVMQGDISALQKQVGAISNIEQIIRAVGDKLYLRKDGISDISYSPTQFFSRLNSGNFRPGIAGGSGWGMFKDENGNWVFETDRVNIRQEMQANTLVINQTEGRGGMTIETAAYIACTRVEDTDTGYVCYFDLKMGSVANLFKVDDVAYCTRWTAENDALKYYRRRVVAVDADNITLSKTDVDGTGVPSAGDNIIHYGNYTDENRQYVKVRDVVGGGYETYIEGLDSVSANGIEYFFIGKQSGKSRWFVGNKDGAYIEYLDGKFNLNNVTLSVSTTVGDKTLEEYIKLVSPPVEQEDIEGFVNNIVDPKLEVIQSQLDGVIETWFSDGVPTLTNYPASDWATDADKDKHLGDLYFDNDSGLGYRFSKDDSGTYYWNDKVDSAIADALSQAAKAQDTADQKRRVFVTTPYTPYEEGDLWTLGASGGIMRCKTTRLTGDYNAADWESADNYSTRIDNAMSEIAKYEYLKNALAQDTVIEGGLIMSTLISLGYKDESGTRHTLAGMNGAYASSLGGRTIASWWGGENVDRFDSGGNKLTVVPEGAATALVRMDGSAYFSKGNVNFKSDGSGWLGGQDGINFTSDGRLVLGNGVLIDISGEKGLAESLESLTAFSLGMSSLLIPCDDEGNELSWDNVTNATSIKAKVGLWTEYFLSARGKDSSGGTGGGGVNLEAVWESLSTATDAYKNVKIDINHIPELAISNITGLESALDAKVNAEEGKGLSTNDFTDVFETKLTGIETGAEVNKIDSVKLNGSTLSISSKSVSINAVTSIAVPAGLSASALSSDGEISISLSSGYTIPKESRLAELERIAALFETDSDGNVYVTGNKGFYSNSFISARGEDSSGAGGGGSSLSEVWTSLKTNTDAYKDTLIDVAHIPSLAISKVTGLQDALDGKLSSGDFSKAQWAAIDSGINDILVEKLTGIETGAQANILESVKLNGTALSVSDKAVNINAATSIAVPTGLSAGTLTSAGKITLSLSSGYVIPKESRLSTIESTLSGKADAATTLSGYGITDAYTSDEVDALLSAKADTSHKHSAADITSGTLSIDRIPTIPYSKTSGVQAALVSGTSIKTINGVSILGSGNIETPDTTYTSKAAASGGTDLSLVTTGEKYTWNAKQAAISDLSTIRSNAAHGATAYGWGDHSKAGYLKSIANLVINGTVYDGTSTVTITTPTYTLASFGITASAAELNYTKGVTSAIQTQLNAKANASALGYYLPLSGGTMSNTNVVTNLNADLLDGLDSIYYLRRVTVANNAENDFDTFESMTLTGRGDPTTGASVVNSPWSGAGPAGGYGVLTYLWSSYGVQFAVGYANHKVYIRDRYYNGTALAWRSSWSALSLDGHTHTFDSLTSKPTTLAGYGITDAPTKTGTGASGTWGINITGKVNDFNSTSAKLEIAQQSSPGWYRVALVKPGGMPGMTSQTIYSNLTIRIVGSWNSVQFSQATLIFEAIHNNCWFTQLSGRIINVTSIRAVNTNTNHFYIDVYVNAVGSRLGVNFEGVGVVETYDAPALITETVTTTRELVLKTLYGTSLTSENYSGYVPTLTGQGATGTWNINISGTAKALTPNDHTYAQCPTIGDLKASLIANMATGGDVCYPVQSYNFQGSNVLSLKNSWATDSYAIADGSRTSFLRLDRYASDKYGAFLMSGMSLAPLAGLSRLMLYDSKWYGPYLLLDEANYSSYALPLTGGTLTGSLNVAGNDLNLGNSAGANLFMNRPTHNYIWANTTGGDLYFGTSTSGVTAPSNAGIGIVGKNVCIGGTTSIYRKLTVASGIAIAGSTNPLIDFRSSSGTVIGYVQAVDAGWMGIGPGNGKGLFIGSDGALTINATPPTTPTGNSIDAPKAIHSTTGVYSEGYVSARGVDSSSDERLKTDIRPLAGALDYILGTKYRSFRWKEDGKPCLGVVAQEELGREHGYLVEKHNDYYSYNYAATTALLGAALQEEDGKVERLKARIAALEAELERLKYNS